MFYKPVKIFIRDHLVAKIVKVYLITLLVYLAVIIIKWNQLPPELPLFYSLPRSAEQLGTPIQLLILPVMSVLIFLGHFLLAVTVYSQEKLAARILILSCLVSTLILLIAFCKIIFLIS